MSKSKGSKKGANTAPDAGVENLPMERTQPGKSTVKGGKGVFDSEGNLTKRPRAKFIADGEGGLDAVPIEKKTAEEQLKALEAKDPAKARAINKIADTAEANQKKVKAKVETPEVPLVPVPKEFQAIADIECIKVQPQRDSLIQVIRGLQAMGDGLTLIRDKDGCLLVHSGVRRVAKLIPYRRLWSFEKTDGLTVRPTAEEAMKLIQDALKALPSIKVEAKASA